MSTTIASEVAGGSPVSWRDQGFWLAVGASVVAACTPVEPMDKPSLPTGELVSPEPFEPGDPLWPGFGRGINLGNALDSPEKEGTWGVVLSEAHFQNAAAAGLDHVRLPVRFSDHALMDAPYTIDETFFERVDWAIDQAEVVGLNTLLDVHHYTDLMADPVGQEPRFLALWEQISARYESRPESLAFEVLNEPTDKLTSVSYNPLLAKAIEVIRIRNATRTIVVDCTNWANINDLATLELPDHQANLVASFHMYEPFVFTHQGAEWAGAASATSGIVFPGPPPEPVQPHPDTVGTWAEGWIERYNSMSGDQNPASVAGMERMFDKADAYMERTGRPLYMGEFAAIEFADDDSRVRYYRVLKREAERRGIGWAIWDDGGSFDAIDDLTGAWVGPLGMVFADEE